MIIYPLNSQYQRGTNYTSVDRQGIPWHWLFPGLGIAGLTILFMGFRIESLLLLVLMAAYAKFVDIIHSLFHLKKHFLVNNRYFQWLDFIHLLHHFDQQKNFTITVPLMDILFGTYLSPSAKFGHIRSWLQKHELNASDFINWHYLLTEATPMQYAIKIAAVQKYKGVAKKVESMKALLQEFQPQDLFYQEAQILLGHIQEFLQYVATSKEVAS